MSDASAVECVFRGVSTTSGHAVAQITNSALIGCYIERTNDDNNGEIVELIASFTRNAVIDCLLVSGGGNASNGIWMNFTNSFQNFNFAAFSGQADRATWLARIGNSANWTTSAATTDTADGSFSVGAVPTPGAVALLGLAGLISRRRK